MGFAEGLEEALMLKSSTFRSDCGFGIGGNVCSRTSKNPFTNVNGALVHTMESPGLFNAESRLKLGISMLLWKRDEIV